MPFVPIKNKLGANDVDLNLIASMLLYNFYACEVGSQAGEYFGVMPPSFEEYIDVNCDL
jgi:hypothetical protein